MNRKQILGLKQCEIKVTEKHPHTCDESKAIYIDSYFEYEPDTDKQASGELTRRSGHLGKVQVCRNGPEVKCTCSSC